MTAAQLIRRKSSGRSPEPLFLVTGAAGFVGSYLTVALLRAGYRVAALVRSRGDCSARERLERVLRWHGVSDVARIQLVQADLAKPGLGLRAAAFASLARRLDGIVHCAASTRFDEAKRAAIYASNLEGTAQLLDLAEAASLSSLHYMSTAFVAGRRGGVCGEAIEEPPGFHNPYESSKHEAERMILDFGRRHAIRVCIYRPSIIVGDSVDGRTLLFNAMYYPVRRARYLLDLLRKDIDENEGQLAAEMGAHLREDGTLELPLRLDTGPAEGGVLNLVPIDYVVQAVLAILASDAEGGIYHLVNKQPCSVAELTAYTVRHFRLAGPAACPSEAFLSAPMTALEQAFDKELEVYRPYLRDTRLFDTTRADRVLEAAGVHCPPFDFELFRRCIDYALACDWRPYSSTRAVPEAEPAPVA